MSPRFVCFSFSFTVFALSCICIAVAVVAWFAYTAAKESEIRTFLVEYEAVVEAAKLRLQSGLDSRVYAAEAAAAVFSLVENDFTIRNFWVRYGAKAPNHRGRALSVRGGPAAPMSC